jgi:tetratricopeptide (TPR) repeat protein
LDIVSWFFIALCSGILLSVQDLSFINLDSFGFRRKIFLGSFKILGLVIAISSIILFVSHAIYVVGLRAYVHNDFDKAFSLISKAIILNPVDQQLHFYYNAAFTKKNNSLSSDIDMIVKLNPEEPVSYWHRSGIVLYAAKKVSNPDWKLKGLTDQSKALSLDINQPNSFETRGSWLYAFNDFAEAERDFKKALGLNPKLEKPYMILASIYSKQGEYDQMLSTLESALKQDPLNIQLKRYINYLKTNPNADFGNYQISYGVDITE